MKLKAGPTALPPRLTKGSLLLEVVLITGHPNLIFLKPSLILWEQFKSHIS